MKTIQALEPYSAVMQAITGTQWGSTMGQMLRACGESLYVHSFHVAQITANLALFGNRNILLDSGIALSSVLLGAYLHDIGYVATGSTEACHKPNDMMTHAEQIAFGKHIELGLAQVRAHTSDAVILDIIGMHHEYVNGTGYPHGKSGDELGPHVRLVSLAHDIACRMENSGCEGTNVIHGMHDYLRDKQYDSKYDMTLIGNFLNSSS